MDTLLAWLTTKVWWGGRRGDRQNQIYRFEVTHMRYTLYI